MKWAKTSFPSKTQIKITGLVNIFIFTLVKWLTLFVLLVSLTASIIPCCEEDSCRVELGSPSTHDGEDLKGGCSPLSACGICGAAIVTGKEIALLKLTGLQTSYGSYPPKEILPIHFYSSWKPPKAYVMSA